MEASAMLAAPPSWRQMTADRVALGVECVERREITLARNAPKMVSVPWMRN